MIYDIRTTVKVGAAVVGALMGGPVAVGVAIGLGCDEIYEAWTDDPEHGIK